MNSPISASAAGAGNPSIGIRWFGLFSAVVGWGSLLFAAILATAWVVIYALIVPRIGEFRPFLETRVSQVIGVPVRIGAIQARVHGLVPTFEMTNVRLLDTQNRDALVFKTITAAISPQSLLELGFEQLLIEQPEVSVRKSQDGKLTIAGLDLSGQHAGSSISSAAADWVFAQNEIVVRSGTLVWFDESRPAPPLALTKVDIVLSNERRSHRMRIDATPPDGWGKQFTITGDFRGPLVTNKPGDWRRWRGQVFADFPAVDIRQLREYASFDLQLMKGYGAVRAWMSVDRGEIRETTLDTALRDVDFRVTRHPKALEFNHLAGRLSYGATADDMSLSTEGLEFELVDGARWPGGNIKLSMFDLQRPEKERGELIAKNLELSALAQIADRLPIEPRLHQWLLRLRPEGLVSSLDARWFGPVRQPRAYEVKGQAERIRLLSSAPSSTSSAASASSPETWHPGISNALVSFKLSERGGSAQIRVEQGDLTLPNVFELPTIDLDDFSSDFAWKLNGDQIALEASSFKFSNRDTQGEGRAKWQTADPNRSGSKSRFPGLLDLQGTLLRADGTKVHRYLPLVVGKQARDYVRDAVREGRATQGRFKVKGDLWDMPFADPAKGEFLIAAQVDGAVLDYVPKSLLSPRSFPWPALTQINGELIFDRQSMTVRSASARVNGAPSLTLSKVEASIANLAKNPELVVSADARGRAQEYLAVVNSSPLSELTNKSLGQTTMSGSADLRLRLALPINNLTDSKVAGTITLAGNEFKFSSNAPTLTQAKGQLGFTESGFTLRDLSARAFGGDVRIEGGTRGSGSSNESVVSLRGQGTATADGLRQAKELGLLSRLAEYASGATSYSANLTIRQGFPELSFSSNLQGLGLNLPQPLTKSADISLPVKYDNSLVITPVHDGKRRLDQLYLQIGSLAEMTYLRDVTEEVPQVLRGRIGVGLASGDAITGLDFDGVAANVNFAQIDLDAWERVFSAPNRAGPVSKAGTQPPSLSAEAYAYLPSILSIRAKELTVQGRKLNNLVVGGSRDGTTWRANLDASELNGYVEYRQSSGTSLGRLYARLARMSVAASAASEIESTLDQQPGSIPSVDLVVENLELAGRRLGRLEVNAANREQSGQREWRISKLAINLPEAQFSASGNWAQIGASQGAGRQLRRRTALNFKLDIADSGELLRRFGYDKTIARGAGLLQGQIAWIGAPWAIDYPSLTGGFNLSVESGQFLKTDPGLAKLLGVLSLQSLPRRLALDFRDVFSEGFAFDFIRGDVKVDQGVAYTNNLQMKGVSAAALLEGSANIAKETQDIKVVVIPEINAGTASLVAAAINPAIGIGTFLAQLVLRRPVIEAATQEFHVTGSWADPQIERVKRARPAPASGVAEGAKQ